MWYNCKFPAHRRTPPLCVQLVVEPIIYGQMYDLLFKPSSKHGVASYLSRKLYLHAIVSTIFTFRGFGSGSCGTRYLRRYTVSSPIASSMSS